MRAKAVAATLAVMICAMAVVAGSTSARDVAKTTVTIKVESGGFFGYVKSPKAQKCANGRKVTLYKQKGSKQKPSVDTKINSDTAQANGDGYQWNTGNTGSHHGKFYARAGKIKGCKADNSKTVQAQA